MLSAKSPLKSPVKRRSGLFPRLHSSTETPDKHTRRLAFRSYYYTSNTSIVCVFMQVDGGFILLLPLRFLFVLFFCLQWPKACWDLPTFPGNEVRDIIQSQLTWDLPQQREVSHKFLFFKCQLRKVSLWPDKITIFRKNLALEINISCTFFYLKSYFRLLFISVRLCFPSQAIHQAEGVQQRQTEHLSFFIQHQQLQQHHRRNGSTGRTGDSEYNTRCVSTFF